MNGVHDMGGMHGMGPIQYDENEPVFHADWEARLFALNRAMGTFGKWNIDASRHQRELIPAREYLRMSYYERFLSSLIELMVHHGFVTRTEVVTGHAESTADRSRPALTVEGVAQLVLKGTPANREVTAAPQFKVGEQVRARNMHPAGHTRLPRYVRGKVGTIFRNHGVFVFPDTNAHFLGEKSQHVYSVRFTAQELWGMPASRADTVYVDMWEDYLERS